jgi:hypothetical protein
MAEVFIQNLRDPSQQIGIMVTIKRMVVNQEGTGSLMWMIQASTLATSDDGEIVKPVYKWTSDQTTFTSDIEDLINQICSQVDWNYELDTTPPEILNTWPLNGNTGVSVDTDIRINIADVAPSSGLDLSSIRVKVKGFDLTDQLTIKGNIGSCSIFLTPGTKYQSAINEDFANGLPVGD